MQVCRWQAVFYLPCVMKIVWLTAMFIKSFPLALHQPALRLLLPTVVTRTLPPTAPSVQNFGGVYGHTLTLSEPGSNDLGIITAADPTGLLVATPAEGDPNFLSVREYKGY
jgi:hypothetical protein